MLCERCKIREANIQYTEVINGVRTEHNFCAQCAKEMDFGQYSAIFDGEFPLAQLLSGLLGGEIPVQKKDRMKQVTCPTCGTTYEEFVNNSCFGCADCYGVFDLLIHDNIKQLQGNDCHKGKRPRYQSATQGEDIPGEAMAGTEDSEATADELIRIWNQKLKEALRMEEYETAAVCRDKLRELKEGKGTDA
ncbi:MAG: excinuclease ABC subunit B [Hungatella sp.]|nr:excinuclease ABC subunit B [Hungatella sp.]